MSEKQGIIEWAVKGAGHLEKRWIERESLGEKWWGGREKLEKGRGERKRDFFIQLSFTFCSSNLGR